MSYILEALRKADAQRERDPARGIHAQSTTALPARPPARASRLAWPAGAVLAIAVAAYAWWSRPDPAPAPLSPAAVAAVTPASLTVAPATSAVVPVATSVLPLPPPSLPAAPVEKPAARGPLAHAKVAAPVAAPVAVAAAPTASAAAPAPAETVVAAKASPAAVAAAKASSAAVAAPAADRILAVSELPADVQRELPKLAITGGVHSENAAQRMLVVGGQVVNEGAELAPGVQLEQIRPKSAVLRYRGFRYSVAY